MKVLILSCGTGGGHNSAAQAIKQALEEKGVQADFSEYLDIVNDRVKDKVNNIYIRSTKGNGQVFKAVYKLGELYQKTKWISPVYGVNRIHKKKLHEYILKNKYDYIVVTHLFPAEALTAIKKEHDIHFIAVATDYVCIPFWQETNPDYFIIPSTELKQDFIDKGIDENKLLPLGIPVSRAYVDDYDKDKLKEELGFDKESKYVLVLTGSMGFGNVTEMIKNLLENIDDAKFIISLGNNKKLLEVLNREYKEENRIITIPYTNALDKYMKISEVILSKPGGLTSTEVATLGKPFIQTAPIPGCENYNAEFFSKRRMSIKCSNIEEVARTTKKLLEDEIYRNEIVASQRKYINKNASMDIADTFIRLVKLKC